MAEGEVGGNADNETHLNCAPIACHVVTLRRPGQRRRLVEYFIITHRGWYILFSPFTNPTNKRNNLTPIRTQPPSTSLHDTPANQQYRIVALSESSAGGHDMTVAVDVGGHRNCNGIHWPAEWQLTMPTIYLSESYNKRPNGHNHKYRNATRSKAE